MMNASAILIVALVTCLVFLSGTSNACTSDSHCPASSCCMVLAWSRKESVCHGFLSAGEACMSGNNCPRCGPGLTCSQMIPAPPIGTCKNTAK